MNKSPLFLFLMGAALGGALAGGAIAGWQSWQANTQPSCAVITEKSVLHGAAAAPAYPKELIPGGDAPFTRIVTQADWDRAQAEITAARQGSREWQQAFDVAKENFEFCNARSIEQSAAAATLTVLYEPGSPSVNLSLLALPGAPRISLNANTQMSPRWILPGRVQPRIAGEQRRAMYYYFDAASSQWQGPFAPQGSAQ